MKLILAFGLFIFTTNPSWGNPCIVVEFLKNETEFQSLLATLNATPAEFDRLYDCWRNRTQPIVIDEVQRGFLTPARDHLRFYPKSMAEKAKVTRFLLELEDLVGNPKEWSDSVDIEPFKKKIQNLAILDRGTMDETLRQLISDFLSDHPSPYSIKSESLRDFAEKTLKISELEREISGSYELACLQKLEKAVFFEYLKNPRFKFRPYEIGSVVQKRTAFNRIPLQSYFLTEFPKLSDQQQLNFIYRSVLYDPNFEQFLDSKYLPQILKTLELAPKNLDPNRKREILKSLAKNYGQEIRNQYPSAQLAQRLSEFWESATLDRGTIAATSLLEPADISMLTARYQVYQRKMEKLSRVGIEGNPPKKDQLLPQDHYDYQVRRNFIEPCNRILNGVFYLN